MPARSPWQFFSHDQRHSSRARWRSSTVLSMYLHLPVPLPVTLVVLVTVLFVIPVGVGIKTHRTRVVVPVAAVAAAIASLWAWVFTSFGEVQVLERVESAQGNHLVVSYVASECEGHRSVSVDEDDVSVRVKVMARRSASACSDVGFLHEVTIALDRPLGSREVVNVGCASDRAGCQRVLSTTPR